MVALLVAGVGGMEAFALVLMVGVVLLTAVCDDDSSNGRL